PAGCLDRRRGAPRAGTSARSRARPAPSSRSARSRRGTARATTRSGGCAWRLPASGTSWPPSPRASRRPSRAPSGTSRSGSGPSTRRASARTRRPGKDSCRLPSCLPPIALGSDLHHLLERRSVLPRDVRDDQSQNAADREVDVVRTGVGLPATRRRGTDPRGERVDGGLQARLHGRRTRGTPSPGAAENAIAAPHAAPERLAQHLAQIAVVALLVCGAEVLIARRVVEPQGNLRVEVAELRVEDGVQEAGVPLVHERHRGVIVVVPVAVPVAAMGAAADPIAQETDRIAEPPIIGGEGQ